MLRIVRVANESRTSRAVTSMMTPRLRKRPTWSARLSRNCVRSPADNAAWMDAISVSACLRIGTGMAAPLCDEAVAVGVLSATIGAIGEEGYPLLHELVPEQSFGFLEPPLQIPHR